MKTDSEDIEPPRFLDSSTTYDASYNRHYTLLFK